VVFKDFTSPSNKPVINATKLEFFCRSEIMGYVIQINLIQQSEPVLAEQTLHPKIAAVIVDFADVFSDHFTLPPPRTTNHEIPLKGAPNHPT
jgi:hypothetical protein